MPPAKPPEQIVEIVVSGTLTFPEIANAVVSGKAVTVTLSDATVKAYSAMVGSPQSSSRSPRPSQRQGADHVRIIIDAADVTIEEVPEAPAEPTPE
jgi:hypothetical protein